jgi:hypothetical protein
MTPQKVTGIIVVGLVIVAAIALSSQDNVTMDKTTANKIAAEKVYAEMMPANEAAFIATVKNARQQYNAGQNDMVKGAARPARKTALCNSLTGVEAVNWVGKIAKLSTNNDGRGVLAISIADDIQVKTWNNALSDTGDHTLIDPSSNLYRRALNLQTGQIVSFSGHFFRNDTDCIQETSLSMSGSMQEPEFLFQFSAVSSDLSSGKPVDTTRKPNPPAEISQVAPPTRPTTAVYVQPVSPTPPQTATTYAHPTTPTLPTAAPSPMFQKGWADRTAWEQWVASLPADHRAGAEYWAGQRSLPHPGTCHGVPAFTTGCEAAKAKLTPADALRKSEPDYKLGWNAYGH